MPTGDNRTVIYIAAESFATDSPQTRRRAAEAVVGHVTPARGVPLPIRSRLHDDDIERIARRVVELLKEQP